MIQDITSSLRKLSAASLTFLLAVVSSVPSAGAADEPRFLEFEIQGELGKVVERFVGSSGRSVVILQDLHCVPEAQKNIAGIVRDIAARGVLLAGLEGAAGEVDPSFLGVLEDSGLRGTVLDSLLKDGSLTGPEWFSADHPNQLELWGVEDPAMYESNLEAFIRHAPFRYESRKILDETFAFLTGLKKKRLSPDIFRLDAAYWRYRALAMRLDKYARILSRTARRRGVQKPGVLRDYLRLLGASRKLEPESFYREFLLLMDSASGKESRDEIAGLVKLIMNYRTGRIPEGRFFSELGSWTAGRGISLERFPHLGRYLESSRLKEDFDPARLNEAMERLTRDLVDPVLFDDTRFLFQVREFLALELSGRDWDSMRGSLRTSVIVERLSAYRRETLSDAERRRIRIWTRSARAYYRSAHRRNDMMVARLLEKMSRRRVREAILVAGGFHTPGLTAALKRHGISYVVILPRTRRFDAGHYEDRLQARPVGLERLLAGDEGLLQRPPAGPAGIALAPALRSARVPLSYPWLRELLIKKAYLLYTLLAHWEQKSLVGRDVIEQAQNSLLEAVPVQDRDRMASFLKSVRMGRILGPAPGKIWLKGTIGEREWIFVLGENTDPSWAVRDAGAAAEGVLSGETAFQVFHPSAYNIPASSGTPGPRLAFKEIMTETPDVPGALKLDLALWTENLDQFLEDPEHTLQMSGEISGGPFKDSVPIDNGRMHLFRYNDTLGRLEMVYRAEFNWEGRSYRLEGVKKLEDDFGLDFSKDMTRLHTRIWVSEQGRERLAWRGMLRFSLLDLPSLVRSMDFSGGASRWQLMAKLKFFRFAAANVARTYLNPLRIFGKKRPSLKPALNRMRLSSERTLLSEQSFDVVVIGSGFGASPVALRLAEAGLRVAVLERGREIPVGDFPDTLSGIMKEIRGFPDVHFHLPGPGRSETVAGLTWNRLGMYDFKLDTENPEGVHVLVGQGLGGGSLIYSSVLERPSTEVFQDPRWPPEIARELGPYFDRTLDILRVSTVAESALLPPGVLPRKTQALFAAADPQAEKRLAPIAVNFDKDKPFPLPGYPAQPECTLCGDCTTGCNVGAKNTLMMNYLPEAVQAGAKIFTQVEVSHLQKDPRGGFRIFYHHTDELDRMGPAAPLRELAAPRVVLSAGIASVAILEQSRRKDPSFGVSPMLGRNFSTNADLSAVGYNTKLVTDTLGFGNRDDERSGMAVGPVITGMVDLRSRSSDPSKQMIIEEGVVPRGLVDLFRYALSIGLLKDITSEVELMEKLRKIKRIGIDILPGYSADGAINHSILYLTMGHDSADGTVVVDKDGNWKVNWPDAAKQEVFENIRAEHRAMTRRLGGSYLSKPLSQAVTVHPLGGVPMGTRREEGVVNHRGQVFDMNAGEPDAVIPGLYVVDASIIPSSLSVNPALTIAALAERAAEKMIEQDIPPVPKAKARAEDFGAFERQDFAAQAA